MKKLTTILIVSSLLVTLTWLRPSSQAATRSVELPGPVMKAHIIDMGQANAALLEFPCGAILIDAGAENDDKVDALIKFLNDFFARRQDLDRTLKSIIITHNHIDHTQALKAVVKNFKVERYIDHGMREGPGTGNPNWVRQEVKEGRRQIAIKEIDDSSVAAAPDMALTDGDIDPVKCTACDPKIRVLHGRVEFQPEEWSEDDFHNKNNHSIVTRVDFGKSCFLFTGDLEEPAIDRLVDRHQNDSMLDVDVYHVGHHGSHNGTTADLLSAMTPKLAVISVGHWDTGKPAKKQQKPKQFTTFAYGHPRRTIIDLLKVAVSEKREHATKQVIFDSVTKKEPYAKYRETMIRKAIYATAWDGTFEIQADLLGVYNVRFSEN